MQLARIFGGADVNEALRSSLAIVTRAHILGDTWLEAVAVECLAKSSVAAHQLSEFGDSGSSLDIYGRAAKLYAVAGDVQSSVNARVQLGSALIAHDREAATQCLNDAVALATRPDLPHTVFDARLRHGVSRAEDQPTDRACRPETAVA